MTRASLREYAMRQQERYALATTRAQKRALLDEIVGVARIHRKAAIRLLRRMARPGSGAGRAGRPRHYGPEDQQRRDPAVCRCPVEMSR